MAGGGTRPPRGTGRSGTIRRRTAGAAGPEGFTLVELLIATMVLIVGMLAVFSAVDASAARATDNGQREAATALAREVIEDARALPFWQVTPTALAPALQGLPPLRTTTPAGWTVQRRATTFTLSVTTCDVDDPRDGTGAHGASFCADGPAAGTTDLAPVDGRRVTVDVSWISGRRTLRTGLTSLIASSALSDAPDVRTLSMVSPGASPVALDVPKVAFTLQTTGTPAKVVWSVDGAQGGEASGSGTAWSFDWPIAGVVDGTYAITATSLDVYGSPGTSSSRSVVLNRFPPSAVTGVTAGRNGSRVEVEWLASPERDVVGYRVYRGTSSTSYGMVCDLTTALACIDAAPPAPTATPFYYWVVAFDRDTQGTLRNGTPSAPVNVNVSNRAPYAPSAPAATRQSDGSLRLTWTASPGDPDPGDAVAFYRVYRDGTALGSRVGKVAADGAMAWTDVSPGAGTHTYWVSAVDGHLAESALVGVTG
ncbi:MAG TPA: type II secretion system protein [Miltoncostaea sp.]|nr:type II secretion system protein [Miltoncostaea sp.]